MARKHLEDADIALLVIDAPKAWPPWTLTLQATRMRVGAR